MPLRRWVGAVVGRTAVALGVLVTFGCTPNVDDPSLALSSPASFSASGSARVPDRWWTTFRERDLDALVNRALASELNLKIAWYRLEEARAVVRRESSSLFPDLAGSMVASRSASEAATENRLELGLSSGYEVDLWGRIRSNVDAARLEAEATHADYETAALTLSAEVVRTWVLLMEALARRALLEEQVETNEKLLTQLRNQFAGGQSESVDVLRQRQLLASTRQDLHATEAAVEVAEHRLAVLSGQPPQNGIAYRPRPLPELPSLPSTGLPADLVQRRPDVQAAFARLAAANREVAAAISDQYPRLTLGASVSTAGGDAERLFDDWARSFAANLAAPLLDAGFRRAEVDRTRAVERQRLYEYGQTILNAFREVEDALIEERAQLQQIRELEEQVSLAEKSSGQLLVEYSNGVSEFIDLLTILASEQQLRRELLLARAILLEFRIALYRALAGGFVSTRK